MWCPSVGRRAVGERGGTPLCHDVFDLERRMYVRFSPHPVGRPPFGGRLTGVGRECRKKEKEPGNATSIPPFQVFKPITVRSHWLESSETPPHAPSSLPRVVEPTVWQADVDHMLVAVAVRVPYRTSARLMAATGEVWSGIGRGMVPLLLIRRLAKPNRAASTALSLIHI